MESTTNTDAIQEPSEINEVRQLAAMLWRGRNVVAVMSVMTFFLSVLYLNMASYSYTTTLTLMPTQSQPRDVVSQFSGLATLAGVNLPGEYNSVSPFSIYPEVARSRHVAEMMIKRWPGVLRILFRDEWNTREKKWHAPQTLTHVAKDMLKRVLGVPVYGWTPPGSAELQQFIVQNVVIEKDKTTGILTLKLNTVDPSFARRFLSDLQASTDGALRLMTLDRAKKYAAYVERKLSTTQASVLRDVLTQSLSRQETLLMMGSSDTTFAAEPIGSPESSVRPTTPVTFDVLLIGVLAGAFLGCLCIVLGIPVQKVGRQFSKYGRNWMAKFIWRLGGQK